MIEQTAGRADHHLGTFAQGTELAIHRCAAVDRCRVKVFHFCAEAVDLFADLDCEFAGRAKDQHLREACGSIDRGEGWQCEGSGFARASC